MKQSFFVFLFVMFSIASYSQESNNFEDNNVYSSTGIEVAPEFPGGPKGFAEYLGKNYQLPTVKGLQGKVYVEFVVEKDGSLNDINVIRDIGHGTGEEAVRVLKESPLWKPGMHNGRIIRIRYSLPIKIDVK